MAETKVSVLENNENTKLTSDNDVESSPGNITMDTNNEEINDSNDSDDMELINADGRHSSATFVIQMDNRCEDLLDIDERGRLALEHCDVGDDDDDIDNYSELECYSSHMPIDNNNEIIGESPYSNEHFGAPVPTPIQLGIKDILNYDMDDIQEIKQKKYPVLPSIGKPFHDPKQEEVDDDDPTINQLDFTREHIENEADFFADYRVNTSVVKPTPRTVPLPPIGQTYSPRTQFQ